MQAKHLNNAEISAAVLAGKATPAMLREYINRVDRKSTSPACVHGHMRCAMAPGGPCIWDVEGRLENSAKGATK